MLEIVLGLTLLLLMLPFLGAPFLSRKKGIEDLRQFEYERLADLSFLEIRDRLLEHTISWNELPKPGEEKGPFSLSPKTIAPSHTVERNYLLKCWKTGEKESKEGKITRLLEIELFLTPALKKKNTPYRFRCLVEKHLLSP